MTAAKKNIRAILLALLVMSVAGVTRSVRAQDQPVAPAKQQQSDDSSRQPGFARQLTHETREAAGEEKDDKAQFKESSSVRLVARITGASTGTAYLLCVLLNFAVIAGIIIWVSRKYLPGAFSARTAAIQKAMQEAQKASEEARRRLAEIEARLMKLDVEIGMMRDTAEKEAAEEEARIQAAAQEDSRKILESAQLEIAAALKSARRELTAYAADLAVGLAQKQIHVDAATDQSLVRNFAGQLGASSGISADAPGKGRQ
ncbi:MAG TPA: ATP synthase F0 subunit B [Candidatus Polarisedimenticolia bacterium]|nr:ATP synthase F0 subunit B [Candidatus Polarisedimenticolia bacterium]